MIPTFNLSSDPILDRKATKNRRQRRASLLKTDANIAQKAVVATQSSLPPLPTLSVSRPPATDLADNFGLVDSNLMQAVLLDWLGQQPIAYHRIYVDVSGSVTAAVWLSLVLARISTPGNADQIDPDGICRFTLPKAQCEAETGLTENDQLKAQRQLKKIGVLASDKTVQLHNKQKTLLFELDMRKLTALLLASSESLAALMRKAEEAAPSLDVTTLEHRAQQRAARLRA